MHVKEVVERRIFTQLTRLKIIPMILSTLPVLPAQRRSWQSQKDPKAEEETALTEGKIVE